MNKYLFENTIQNIKRSGWRAYAVIFMMSVTYVILGILLTVMLTSQNIADYFVQKPEVIGFFNDDVPEEQILEVKRELESMESVSEVKYVSREDAMKSFMEKNQDNSEVLEAVTENVFPAHLNVRVKNLDFVTEIADYFRNNEKISDVLASEDILGTLNKIVNTIQIIGAALLIVFTISTVLIIFLTVGLTVYTQKNEIIVMKLVGATDSFVRGPYLLQSLFFTLISVFISLLILIPPLILEYNSVMKSVLGELDMSVLETKDILIGSGIMFLFGFILSYTSSYFATKRYIEY